MRRDAERSSSSYWWKQRKTPLSQHELLECKGLDEITSEHDMCQALEEQTKKNLRGKYLFLPNAMLIGGKVKIRWTDCRLRKLINSKRCYRCTEFEHGDFFCAKMLAETKKNKALISESNLIPTCNRWISEIGTRCNSSLR